MPTDLRSAGNTSPWILRAGSNARIADAERIKSVYGTVLTGGSDEREMITVPPVGDDEREPPQIVSRATMVRIIKPRVEEILEMVRDRLADSPFAAEPRARVVLTGGASQLTGIADLAAPDSRPAGADRPPARLWPACRKRPRVPAFAVAAGLLVYPQAAHLEHVEPRQTRQLMTGTGGYFGTGRTMAARGLLMTRHIRTHDRIVQRPVGGPA